MGGWVLTSEGVEVESLEVFGKGICVTPSFQYSLANLFAWMVSKSCCHFNFFALAVSIPCVKFLT